MIPIFCSNTIFCNQCRFSTHGCKCLLPPNRLFIRVAFQQVQWILFIKTTLFRRHNFTFISWFIQSVTAAFLMPHSMDLITPILQPSNFLGIINERRQSHNYCHPVITHWRPTGLIYSWPTSHFSPINSAIFLPFLHHKSDYYPLESDFLTIFAQQTNYSLHSSNQALLLPLYLISSTWE